MAPNNNAKDKEEVSINAVEKKLYMDANGFSAGEDVGGVTGSKRVEKDGKIYQLKSSILEASFKRKFLAERKDHQNFGEVIAAKIGAAIMDKAGEPKLIPDLSLVYDEKKKRCLVASEYLSNVDKGTLDDYAVKSAGVKKKKTFLSNVKYNIAKLFGKEDDVKIKYEKHIDKVTTSSNPEKREFSMSKDENKSLRQDLANAIAISALTGDHDINPGNMIAIKGGRLARIDFGHAFNDLLNHSKVFGGEVRNEGNQILDFINRTEVSGGSSKLWRDYDIMPSQELANAFKEMSTKSAGLKKGVDDAKESFKQLVTDLQKDPEGNKEVIKHITDSLLHINKSVKGEQIDNTKGPNEVIDKVFENIHKFSQENQDRMGDVGKLMQMQVNIDKLIENKRNGQPLDKDLSLAVKVQYEELCKEKAKGIHQGKDGIEWCKLDKKTKPHIGDLDSYIDHRTKQQGLNKEFSQQITLEIKAPSKISAPLENPGLEKTNEASNLAAKMQKRLSTNVNNSSGVQPPCVHRNSLLASKDSARGV